MKRKAHGNNVEESETINGKDTITMYVYQKYRPGQWSVGRFTGSGHWESESLWNSAAEAAERVHWLNEREDEDEEEESAPR